jgi:hypothetical protein
MSLSIFCLNINAKVSYELLAFAEGTEKKYMKSFLYFNTCKHTRDIQLFCASLTPTGAPRNTAPQPKLFSAMLDHQPIRLLRPFSSTATNLIETQNWMNIERNMPSSCLQISVVNHVFVVFVWTCVTILMTFNRFLNLDVWNMCQYHCANVYSDWIKFRVT